MKRTIMDYPPEQRTNDHETIFARGREKGRAKMKLLMQERIDEVSRVLQCFGSPCQVRQMSKTLGYSERTIRKYVKALGNYVVKSGWIYEIEKESALEKE